MRSLTCGPGRANNLDSVPHSLPGGPELPATTSLILLIGLWLFAVGTVVGSFPERLHLPHPLAEERDLARVALSQVLECDPRAGQYPDRRLAGPVGALPIVPRVDLGALPVRRGAGRALLRGAVRDRRRARAAGLAWGDPLLAIRPLVLPRDPRRPCWSPARFMDYDLTVIPDEVTVTGMILGLGLGTLFSLDPPRPLPRPSTHMDGFWAGMTGLLVGGGLTWFVRFTGSPRPAPRGDGIRRRLR